MEEGKKSEASPRPGGGKICRHWYKGHCWLESTCGFLHPPRQTMPPNLVFEYKNKQADRSNNNNANVVVEQGGDATQAQPKKEHTGGRLCHHWERGYCWLGNTCGFLHTGPSRQIQQQYAYGQGYGKLGDPNQLVHYNQPYRNGVRIVSPPRGQQTYQMRPIQPYHVPHPLQTENYPPLTNMHALNNPQGGYY